MGTVRAVLTASGGLGGSALSLGLGMRSCAAGRSVVVVDLDGWGGGLDVLADAESLAGWRWPQLLDVDGAVDGAALLARLPVAEGVPVLSMDRDHPREVVLGALPRILPPVVRGLAGAVDELVFDLGRDAQVLSVALPLVDFLYVVIGAGLSSLAAASVCVPRAAVACAETFVVLRGGRTSIDLQPQVEAALGVPVLTHLDHEGRLDADLVDGRLPGWRPRGAVARCADACLALERVEAAA